MNENKFPKFISSQVPEGSKSNSKIFLALAIGQITIGVINLIANKSEGYYITYFIFGVLLLAAYYYDFHYNSTKGILFTDNKIQQELTRWNRMTIMSNQIKAIDIRLLEIDFQMKDGSTKKMELGNFMYKSVKEIKELAEEFAQINKIELANS